MFLKRISDVYDEEGEKIEKETAVKELAWKTPDEHDIHVPAKAHWNHIKTKTQNLGEIINKANDALEEAQHDAYRRFNYGIPPKSYGDYAFVQHMISTLNVTGRAGVVLPHGVLFRGGAEGKIRKGIVEEDLVEAVIGLPSNLFYGTGIPACLFIMNKRKTKERAGKIFFIYGANDYLEGKNQNKLRGQDIKKIIDAYREYKTVDKYC